MKKVKSGSDISFSFNVKVTDKTTVDDIILEASDIIKVRFAEYKVEPEESEDEKIRDAIEGAIRVYGKTQGEWIGGYDMDTLVVHLREAFGALAKQKEPKPGKDKYQQELEATDRWQEGYEAGYNAASKPAEWSEDYREEDIQTRFAFYTYKDDPSVLYLSNVFVEETSRNHGFGTRILKAAEKAAEAIGAITICLKVKQDSPANAWYRKRGYGFVAFEDGYDWLEKNLEYLKPAKSAEWSEEDELMRTVIIQTLERFGGRGTTGMQIDWLKSLRPQPHWKPSEEQMKELRDASAIMKCNSNDIAFPALITLCEQLEKQM